MHTESFEISVLIKVGKSASVLGYGGRRVLQDGTVFEKEYGEFARRVLAIVDLYESISIISTSNSGKPCQRDERKFTYHEILVFVKAPRDIFLTFELGVMLVDIERGRGVLEPANAKMVNIKTWWIFVVWRCLPLPSDKVSHGSNGEIDDIVHATSVDGINHRTPLVTLAPMRVEGSEVEGGVT